MTHKSEIENDPKYKLILDHGFVGLVDFMGSDDAVEQAARLSYGKGTRKTNETRGLIRYLMSHKHTSPFEMCQIKLHIKIPIFVMRQLVRHRTAALNEYSGRYSEMVDEFYIPADEHIAPQSLTNKQGRAGELGAESIKGVKWLISESNKNVYDTYKILLGGERGERELEFDPTGENQLLEADFPGISRELARMVLSVNNYTEVFWCQSLHNMLHLLKLRTDPHAQYEIRVMANAIYETIKPLFPMSIEAWEDYVRDAKNLSRMERELLRLIFVQPGLIQTIKASEGDERKALALSFGVNVRELDDFVKNVLDY